MMSERIDLHFSKSTLITSSSFWNASKSARDWRWSALNLADTLSVSTIFLSSSLFDACCWRRNSFFSWMVSLHSCSWSFTVCRFAWFSSMSSSRFFIISMTVSHCCRSLRRSSWIWRNSLCVLSNSIWDIWVSVIYAPHQLTPLQ